MQAKERETDGKWKCLNWDGMHYARTLTEGVGEC